MLVGSEWCLLGRLVPLKVLLGGEVCDVNRHGLHLLKLGRNGTQAVSHLVPGQRYILALHTGNKLFLYLGINTDTGKSLVW